MSTKRPHDDDELDQPSSKAFLVQKWLNGVEVVAERDEDASNADDSEGTIVLSSDEDSRETLLYSDVSEEKNDTIDCGNRNCALEKEAVHVERDDYTKNG
ncbi:hypothetical protein AAVH_24171, partial [Aphelenchoides avenae]